MLPFETMQNISYLNVQMFENCGRAFLKLFKFFNTVRIYQVFWLSEIRLQRTVRICRVFYLLHLSQHMKFLYLLHFRAMFR